MKTVLITGFEPFGGADVNPALEAVTLLEGKLLEGGRIVTCSVPVVRGKSVNTVIEAIEQHKPDIVITVGQAAGRGTITPERVAINLDDYRIPDNEGNQPIDEPVVENADAAYFSTLPIKAICRALNNQDVPASVSNTAGTYVCNHLFYGIQHYLRDSVIRHGFVHIPLLPEQAEELNMPGMALDTIVKGLELFAQTCIDFEEDIVETEGAIC
ncbi:pyrrolidone-carboxylate peptidase [Vibrio nigripulchritudo ATCC 27043]|uniref:Pyrrolidone-carboxylate peptidase n=1 Tax=Vibrio nigripulchritudo TaxID=28173 RepID=U4KC95_9VIBR|nr:pyroglutamyl-peptidase I [Vibrio nigripulchritudo]EGU50323.1 pyrrolidone-carboxylate peptidase [Vibrio nigripulchritudo ATCC 27043]CCN80906.1 Pyrrolidone-carboxylate peptidase [Vibrio nigripulchritudo BLFn1]CCN87977.1 Pyrrolidone-carboxylate peptidase [Vibrio nigripulchritudo SFn27]CCN96832.1 Pyrrolidone-carboxylate peptidase [Vibrio nigripulchritudo ENn2]CCO43515.1 Pyrrolidone-carboxylate peptidase [Vibrio nigripulchritudo SFn135]